MLAPSSIKPVVISSANGNKFKNGGDVTAVQKAFAMIVGGSDVLDAVIAGLRQEGVKVAGKIEESEYGRFGWVVDPEGHRIELWEPPKEYSAPEKAILME